MSTTKQKRVARLIIENTKLEQPLTGGEIVEKSGYGSTMKLYPGRILETEGVQQALNDYGFNEDAAKQVVASILHSEETEPRDRLKASDMIFKVHGTYAPEKKAVMNLTPDIAKTFDDLTLKLNELYRSKE